MNKISNFEILKDMIRNLSLYKVVQKDGYYTYYKALNNSSIADVEKRHYERTEGKYNHIEYVEMVDEAELYVSECDMFGYVNRNKEPYNTMDRLNLYFVKTPNEQVQKDHYVIALCGVYVLNYLVRKNYNVDDCVYYVIPDVSMI